jgi:hypothetical protein
VWDQDNDGVWDDDEVTADVEMGGKAGKWAEVNFTVDEPTFDGGTVSSYEQLVLEVNGETEIII